MAVTDEQFQELTDRVTALETNFTSINTSVNTLTSAVESLTAAVEALQQTQIDTFPLSHSGQDVEDGIEFAKNVTGTSSELNSLMNKWYASAILAGYPAAAINSALDKAMRISDINKLNQAVSNTYPLVLKWGVREHTMELTSSGGTYWATVSNTFDALPQVLAGAGAIAVCDFGNAFFGKTELKYRLNGKSLEYTVGVEYDDTTRGTYTFKVYWIAFAINNGGGTIG